MSKSIQSFIALLRGVNVSGRNKVPMADLRSACGKLGWADIQTYIQSGNLIFSACATEKALESELEKLIEKQFGIVIPVIVRSAASWPNYVKNNPFPEASQTEPNHVMLCLSKSRPNPQAEKELRERARDGEQVIAAGDALWIYFKQNMARSKLSPSVLDRLAGSPVTARNWRTVLKIDEMLQP